MSGEDDDEALTWAGGRDPSHYESPEPKAPKPIKAPKPAKATAPTASMPGAAQPADGALAEARSDGVADELPPPISAVVLVCLGVLGGIYALYTVGWFVSFQRLAYVPTDALELVSFKAQQVLGVVAPPLWFVVTLLMTRDRKPAVRLLWLVIGALALVPWSFALGR